MKGETQFLILRRICLKLGIGTIDTQALRVLKHHIPWELLGFSISRSREIVAINEMIMGSTRHFLVRTMQKTTASQALLQADWYSGPRYRPCCLPPDKFMVRTCQVPVRYRSKSALPIPAEAPSVWGSKTLPTHLPPLPADRCSEGLNAPILSGQLWWDWVVAAPLGSRTGRTTDQ